MNRRSQRSFSGRRYGGLLPSVLLCVTCVLAVFGRVGGHDFLMYDDEDHLVKNERLNPVTWRNVGLFWVEQSYWGLYIPLSYTFFAAEAAVARRPLPHDAGWTLSPAVFHLGNLVLHVGCVLLVYTILRRLFRHEGAACAGALLFGLHPVQVESVAWISETRGLLCAWFSLLAIWQFDLWSAGTWVCGRRLPSPTEPLDNASATGVASYHSSPIADSSVVGVAAEGGGVREGRGSSCRAKAHYALATVAFALALLSKPAAVATPLIVGVLTVGMSRCPLRRILPGLGPWLLAAAGWAVLTKFQQPSGQMAFGPPVWTRPLIAGDALAFYLWELVGPLWYVLGLIRHALLIPWHGLEPLASWASPHLYGPDYGRSPAWVIEQRWFYFTWLVPACLLATLAWWPVVSRNLPGARGQGSGDRGQIQHSAFSIQHSGFSLPSHPRVWLTAAGVFIAWLLPVLGLLPFDFQRISTVADRYLYLSLLGPALALSWFLARRWSGLRMGVAASILGLLGVLSFLQTAHWRDNASLIACALRVNPRSALAKNHRGALLNREGKHAEAIKSYRDALADDPTHEETYLSLANSWVALRRKDEAEKTLREALVHLPDRPPIRFKLAEILAGRGALDEAEVHYRRAFELDEDFAQAYLALGKLRFQRGAAEEAVGLYRKALDVAPDYVEAHVNLGTVLQSQRKYDEARYHYREALRIRPDWPQAHFNMANLLLAQGAIEAAVKHYRAALESYPKYARAHVNLGIALFQQNKTREAIRHYQAALQIQPDLVEAHVHLGHALAAEGRPKDAAAELRAALRLVPSGSAEAEQIRRFLQPYEGR